MAIIDLQNVRIFLTAVSDSNIRKTTTLKVALLASMIKAGHRHQTTLCNRRNKNSRVRCNECFQLLDRTLDQNGWHVVFLVVLFQRHWVMKLSKTTTSKITCTNGVRRSLQRNIVIGS